MRSLFRNCAIVQLISEGTGCRVRGAQAPVKGGETVHRKAIDIPRSKPSKIDLKKTKARIWWDSGLGFLLNYE